MRDIILGRKVGTANMVRARRAEKRMVEACERRILEFPLDMDAREVAKELKREGWYAWASDYANIILRIERVRAKSGKLRNAYGFIPIALSQMPKIIPTKWTNNFDLAVRSPRVFLQQLRQS